MNSKVFWRFIIVFAFFVFFQSSYQPAFGSNLTPKAWSWLKEKQAQLDAEWEKSKRRIRMEKEHLQKCIRDPEYLQRNGAPSERNLSKAELERRLRNLDDHYTLKYNAYQQQRREALLQAQKMSKPERTVETWKNSEAYKKFQTERKKVYSWYIENSKQDYGFVRNWYNSAMSRLNKAEDLAYKNYLAGIANLSFPVINYPKKVPKTFSTKAAEFGLGKGNEPRIQNLSVKVPPWGKQLIVKVEHGYDDTGDRKMELFIYNPEGDQLAHQFLGSQGWEDVSVTASNPGVYRVVFRDMDTKTGGDYPGNGITYKLEINGFVYK